jgi:hypothetical protein
MDRHNGIMIVVVFVVVLVSLAASYALAVHGKDYAAFLTVATGALGTLTPSALKQNQEAATASAGGATVSVGSGDSDAKS